MSEYPRLLKFIKGGDDDDDGGNDDDGQTHIIMSSSRLSQVLGPMVIILSLW